MNTVHFKLFLTSMFIVILPQCAHNSVMHKSFKIDTSKPLTVFIHGTLFHCVNSFFVHSFDCPFGFNKAQTQGNKYLMGRIPYILHETAPDQFPLENFYLFGWSGKLSFEARKKAAQDLYYYLKGHKGPITLIGHSHGCNVALSLAQIVQEVNDTSLSIDRLILLAGPVQQATASYTQSPLFKKIYSFYSTADMMQVLDPQGLYTATRQQKRSGEAVPLFSQRTFDCKPHIIQTRVLFNGQSISHIDFILKSFINRLPKIIKLLDSVDSHSPCYSINNTYTINIESDSETLRFITSKSLKKTYVPRARKL